MTVVDDLDRFFWSDEDIEVESGLKSLKYSPEQPRDERGRFGEGGEVQHGHEHGMLAGDEFQAVSKYQLRAEAAKLNGALRGGQQLTPDQQEHVRLLDQAVTKHVVGVDHVYRGMVTTHAFQPGEDFSDRAFISVSKKPGIADEFASGIGSHGAVGQPVLMDLHVDPMNQHYFQGNNDLAEMVLPRDMQFTVAAVTPPLSRGRSTVVSVEAKPK